MNLALWLKRSALSLPYQPAIAHGNAVHATWRGFAASASGMATHLRESLGLRQGDRVALVMANCPQYLECLYAIWWAGLVAVPVNAKLHPREAAFILENAGAKAVFIAPEWQGDINAALAAYADPAAQPRVVDVTSAEYAQWRTGPAMAVADVAYDDAAWLFYTSGTTGRPKGAMLSHRNLAAMTFNYFTDVDSIAHDDCILHAAPMSHGSGLYNFAHVLAGACQVIPESGGFDPAEIHDLLRHRPGMSFFAAPTMVKRLTDYAPWDAACTRNLKTIVYGGGPMYVADIQYALQEFGNRFVQIYGQGESPMTITALSKFHLGNTGHPLYLQRIASVGLPHSGIQVKVCNDDGQTLEPGAIGEVCVKGDTVMLGYWQDPDATARTLRDGWLWTGDMGCFDDDGFLTLKDRSKDLIISGGSNIYPREVEEVLNMHPDVAEVSVVGKRHALWGEVVVAFVVLRDGAVLDHGALDELCLKHIARFKRPKEYRLVSSLPKNHYGKVMKMELRERLDEECGFRDTQLKNGKQD